MPAGRSTTSRLEELFDRIDGLRRTGGCPLLIRELEDEVLDELDRLAGPCGTCGGVGGVGLGHARPCPACGGHGYNRLEVHLASA